MIFGDKKNSKRTAQLKSVLEDVVDEALKRQARELVRQQEEQNLPQCPWNLSLVSRVT